MEPLVRNIRQQHIISESYDPLDYLVVRSNDALFVPEKKVGTTGGEQGVCLVGCFSVILDFTHGAILTHYGAPDYFHQTHLEAIQELREDHHLFHKPSIVFIHRELYPPREMCLTRDGRERYKRYVSLFYNQLHHLIDSEQIHCLVYPFDSAVQVSFGWGHVALEDYSTRHRNVFP